MTAPIDWTAFGISDEDWRRIDEIIFSGDILGGCKLMRQLTGMGMKEIIDVKYRRHLFLRERFPDRFVGSIDDYYRGVDS